MILVIDTHTLPMQARLAPNLQISCLHLLSIGIQYILADPATAGNF